MNMIKVSVIIPCYNRASVVGDTIRCVLQQTLPPDEIIAVDDGSTDRTVEVLESFGSRVRILRQKNAGPGTARNTGLVAASGEFVWFMDSDDLASLNQLEVQVRALERSGADVAVAPWIKCRLEGSRAYAETHVLQQNGLPRDLTRALVSRWTLMLQTALFRRSILAKTGGFDPSQDAIAVEDQLLFLKCLLAGARIVHTPECLVVYRTEGANKLTEGGLASERRFVNWGRFLLEARRLCVEAGEDPLSWFFFRQRLWCVSRHLAGCTSLSARETAALVAAALQTSSNLSIYALAQKGVQWLGGIRQRVFGDRSPLAYRAGPLRPRQIRLLSELGYSLSDQERAAAPLDVSSIAATSRQ
jgi:glycosyltransferase involved in cell wall biosynthesis